MDDRKHAGPHWLLLLSSVFPLAGQQNSHTPLGPGDDALCPCWTLQTVVSRKCSSEEKSPHYRRESASPQRYASIEGGLFPAQGGIPGHRVVPQRQGRGTHT